MNVTVTMNVFTIVFLLAIAGAISTTPFAHCAHAWACVPILMASRESAGMSKRSVALRENELKLQRQNGFSRPVRQHGSISSVLSLPMAFFDEPSTMPLANRTSVAPFDSKLSTSVNNEEKTSDSKPKSPIPAKNDIFFIRPAMFVDMDRASKILADGFFKGPDSNWFKYQYEKFITYLSLEANFPRTPQQRSRYEIFVACCVDTGEVLGIAEIDARGPRTERTSKVYQKSGGSPYMCNLAVDEKHKRKGIATSLVYECERQVQEWYLDDESGRKKRNEEIIDDDTVYSSKDEIINDIFGSNSIDKTKADSSMRNSVCLKVRESNKAAVQMYLNLGYSTVSEEIENGKPDENILLMRKELTPSSPPP